MIPLYHCAACGFLSTLGSEFKRRSGVRFDLDCLDRADRGEMPVATWVAEKIAEAEHELAIRAGTNEREDGHG